MTLRIRPRPQHPEGVHEGDSPELIKRKLRGWELAKNLNGKLHSDNKLDWYQAEFIADNIVKGAAHYKTHFFDAYGGIKCPAGDDSGPCLCHFGDGLWFDPGLGKTATALVYDMLVREFLKVEKDPRIERPSLVLTTTSAKWQWATLEIPKWRRDLMEVGRVMLIDGDSLVRESAVQLIAQIKPTLVILHHAQIGPQTKEFFELIQDIDWLGLYVDEDQYFKNWTSGRTVRKNALYRGFELSITGTPQSGFPNKLHAIVHGIAPGGYGEYVEPVCTPGSGCPLPQYTRRKFKDGCTGCFNYLSGTNECRVGGHRPSAFEGLGIKYQHRPGVFGHYDDFVEKYCYGNGRSVTGSRNEFDLNRRIYENRWASRVTVKDVYGERNIPIIKVALKMNDGQQELYDILCAGLRRFFDENMQEIEDRGSTFVLALLTHARRATTMSPGAFMLAYGGHPPSWASLDKYAAHGESTKIEWALSFIEDNVRDTQNKMIIGSEWDDCIQEMAGKLEKAGMKRAHVGIVAGSSALEWNAKLEEGEGEYFGIINGDVKGKDRTALQMAFNTDKRLKVILMTRAGYEAISLTGGLGEKETMYVSCLGVPWLPDQLRQLFGRADRRDMKGNIAVYLPACAGTVDEMLHSRLYGKSLSSEKVIDGNFSDDTISAQLSLHDAKTLKEMLGNF